VDIKNIETDKYFSLRQEHLYWNSEFLEKSGIENYMVVNGSC